MGSNAIGGANMSVMDAPDREYFENELMAHMYRARMAVKDIGAFESTTTGMASARTGDDPAGRRREEPRMKHRRTSWTKRALLFAWELPQNVLGALSFAGLFLTRNVLRVRFERERLMVELTGSNAVSLGLFVFWTAKDNGWVPVGPENRDHEYGHSIQSRWLGPLYLPLVGVPSTMRVGYAIAHKTFTGRRWNRYYSGWPERQADVLGRADISRRPSA